MVVSLLLTPLLLGVDPSAPNGEGNAPNENPLLIPGWVHMNYQPFPWEALYGGRWRLDRYDLVSCSGTTYKRHTQLMCAKHQHVQPMS